MDFALFARISHRITTFRTQEIGYNRVSDAYIILLCVDTMTTRILSLPENYTELRHCSYLGTCPVFDRFRLEGLRNFWIRLYCQGTRQSMCQRKVIKISGRPVPEDLLPNGDFLPPGQ